MCPFGDERLSRRCLLERALRGGAGLATLGTLPFLPACSGPNTPPGPRIELSRLQEEKRVVLLGEEIPIELRYESDQVRARSLICTHQGCQVAWDAEARRYLCPCHEGVYDEEGKPLLGPPQSPLREYPVRLEDGFVYVDLGEVQERL